MSGGFRSLLLLSVLPRYLAAQTLEHRVAAVANGTVRMTFADRAGVCGQAGNGIIMVRETEEWQADCESQPVRVALRVQGQRVFSMRTYVGGHWRPDTAATDLGTVRPQEAAVYFVGLSERAEVTGDPLLPATLADSITIWPALLRVARKTSTPGETRSRAVFWLGQAAAAAAGQALDSIAGDDRGDREVRKQAIFALSQRPREEGVPALIRIARSNADLQLRKTALFWLGQSEDPRALSLFQEILR